MDFNVPHHEHTARSALSVWPPNFSTQSIKSNKHPQVVAKIANGFYPVNAEDSFKSLQVILNSQLLDQRFTARPGSPPLFPNAEGWTHPKYYSTIQEVGDGSDFYILGRGNCGMHIFKYSGGIVSKINVCGIAFSNAWGWDHAKHYSTISGTVVGGNLYIIGRGACGMHIFMLLGNKPIEINRCSIKFSNANGWDKPEYYSTIHTVESGGYLYILGRGPCGMRIFKLVGDKPIEISRCDIEFSDANGWNKPKYYSTIQTTESNGILYIMGRGKCGIEMYHTWEGKIYPVSRCDIPFSDSLSWNKVEHYSTITSTVLYGEIYIIGRAPCGIDIYKISSGKSVQPVSRCEIPWSNDAGWSSGKYYSTISAIADSNGVWISGRENAGMLIYKLFDKTPYMMSSHNIPWTDNAGWDNKNRYSTIGSTVVDNTLHIYGRDACGVTVYKVSGRGIPQPVIIC